MSGILNLHHLGRLGNQIFAYAFARGYCERHGLELHTDPWAGESIFELSHPRCTVDLPRKDENTLVDGDANISYRSYSQRQKCADYYSLAQIKEWFRFRPEIAFEFQKRFVLPATDTPVCHVRRGDFVGTNSIYPLVSFESYRSACAKYGLSCEIYFVTDALPLSDSIFFVCELSFVPDFYCMAHAHILLRANSSFSFWAGAIAQANHDARIFSPVIEGLKGGIEHHCEFIESNSARLADLDFVEPINIKP